MNDAGKKIIELMTEPVQEISRDKVSLRKACQALGKVNTFDMIADRIQEDAEQSPELFDYIYVNFPDQEFDIFLESDGVFLVGSILMEFWNESDVMNLYKYLRSLDKVVDIKNKALCYSRFMREDALQESIDQLSEEDGDPFVVDAMITELEKRRLFRHSVAELRNAGGSE